MQKSVCEFLFENVSLQVVLDAFLDNWQVQNAVDVGTRTWALLQAQLNDILKGVRIVFW